MNVAHVDTHHSSFMKKFVFCFHHLRNLIFPCFFVLVSFHFISFSLHGSLDLKHTHTHAICSFICPDDDDDDDDDEDPKLNGPEKKNKKIFKTNELKSMVSNFICRMIEKNFFFYFSSLLMFWFVNKTKKNSFLHLTTHYSFCRRL